MCPDAKLFYRKYWTFPQKDFGRCNWRQPKKAACHMTCSVLQELTGIDDIDRCKELMQRHNWDMEVSSLTTAIYFVKIYNHPQL